MKLGVYITVCASLLIGSEAAAITPEDKCEADKNKIAGKYAFCRQKEEANAIKKGSAADYSKCDQKLLAMWGNAEAKAVSKGTTCIDAVSDTDIQSFVTAHADAVAAALDGGALPECGDGSLNAVGEQCDGTDLGGEGCATFGFGGGTLSCDLTCRFDVTDCSPPAGPSCGNGIIEEGEDCEIGDLDGGDCVSESFAGGSLACGTGCAYDTTGCWSTRFVDNGDGTVTDNSTSLMWEKKNLDSSSYHYLSPCNVGPDWFRALEFAAGLNGSWLGSGTSSGFAGYKNWRLPTIEELQSILGPCSSNGCIDPVFGPAIPDAGCVGRYWSSTSSLSPASFNALRVSFGPGTLLSTDCKTCSGPYVRAVRDIH